MTPWLALCATSLCASLVLAGSSEPFLDQGFQFDYTPSGVAVPVPTITQCDTIPLSWGRAAFTTGPNPQAPYYIQVYTSTFLFPSVINVGSDLQFNWPVPYIPGTQYQICMFDSNGVSGGCQRMTTVVPVENATVENPPICTNLTYPAGILEVEAKDHTGTLSQFGWVDQCTDISIQPKNGTAPFILTVAPALHPPWNITSNDMSPINWTVQLSWGSPFFISLVDASGQTWAYGPLHSGGQGPTECLALGTATKKDVSENVAIGSGIGGLVAGSAIGALAAWFIFRRRRGRYYEPYGSGRIHSNIGKGEGRTEVDNLLTPSSHVPHPSEQSGTAYTSHSSRPLVPGSAYEVEPFTMPESSSEGLLPRSPIATGSTSVQPSSSPVSQRNADSFFDAAPGTEPEILTGTTSSQTRNASSGGQVYVVHHDGGRAPVTVYTSEGTEIIELPPRYNAEDSPVEERRRAGATPRKAPRSPGLSGVVR